VTLYEIDNSADLGGSSKYSSENLEDRSGERFHENTVDHELVDPKVKINLVNEDLCLHRNIPIPKGNKFNIT